RYLLSPEEISSIAEGDIFYRRRRYLLRHISSTAMKRPVQRCWGQAANRHTLIGRTTGHQIEQQELFIEKQ
ncbi:MAG: hypothetical protein ACI3YD_03525, partial [Alloprevotella sp.]